MMRWNMIDLHPLADVFVIFRVEVLQTLVFFAYWNFSWEGPSFYLLSPSPDPLYPCASLVVVVFEDFNLVNLDNETNLKMTSMLEHLKKFSKFDLAWFHHRSWWARTTWPACWLARAPEAAWQADRWQCCWELPPRSWMFQSSSRPAWSTPQGSRSCRFQGGRTRCTGKTLIHNFRIIFRFCFFFVWNFFKKILVFN